MVLLRVLSEAHYWHLLRGLGANANLFVLIVRNNNPDQHRLSLSTWKQISQVNLQCLVIARPSTSLCPSHRNQVYEEWTASLIFENSPAETVQAFIPLDTI